jgi:hypothetical protein
VKFQIQKGTTSKILRVFIMKDDETDGSGLTATTFDKFTLSYIREADDAATSVTTVTAAVGTWTSGGIILVDDSLMPGIYEVGVPNAALPRGSESVLFFLTDAGANNIADTPFELSLTDRDPHGQRDADHRNPLRL